MIEGGYILLSRKFDQSEIINKPPHYREIFLWLLRQANHKGNGKIKRGQCFRSFADMQEGLKWFVGYRKMTYKKHDCEKATKWLRESGMIATTKSTRGLLITICNYDSYQTPNNYESDTKATSKATSKRQCSDTINKNEKNEKNEKKSIYDSKFQLFWNAYPKRNGKKVGKKTTQEKFFKLKEDELDRVIENAKNYGIGNDFPKDPERFLINDFWKDWDEPQKINKGESIWD